MFGKKAKELMLELEKRNTEIEQLKARVSGLEDEVARLKGQEASVARAITEAGNAAARIEEDANKKRDEMLEKASMVVQTAHTNAEAVITDAETTAANIRKAAEEYAETVRRDADSYSENTRTDVNIYVERSIIASQLEVKKRKDVSNEINSLLKETVRRLTEQNNTFIELLNSIVGKNEEKVAELCYDVEKCSCSCKDCENPCSVKSDEHMDEPKADEQPRAVEEDVPVAADEDTASDEVPAVTEDKPENELPDEYESPAQLMQNIYHILNRQLPNSEEAENGQPDNELPHDEDLASIVSDVIDN